MRLLHGLSHILPERILRRVLIAIAIAGLTSGLAAHVASYPDLADIFWSIATLPVAAGLVISIIRDLIAGHFGVDAIALIAMIGALALGQPLAGAVIALMYSGGNLLEDIAVARAEKNSLTSPSATGCSCVPRKSFRSMASSTSITP